MVKKSLVIFLAIVLSFSLVGCGGEKDIDPSEVARALIPSDVESEEELGLAVYVSESSFQTNYNYLTKKIKEQGMTSVEEGVPTRKAIDEKGEALSEWLYIGYIDTEEMPVIVSIIGNDKISNVIIAVGKEAVEAVLYAEE